MKNYQRLCLGCGLLLLSGAAQAVNINGFEFDLGQFTGAAVTTSITNEIHIHGNLWDNAAGVDLFTLGELAAGQFNNVDPGDHISLGDQHPLDWFTLTYGTGVTLGAGDGSLFVLYESSGRLPGAPDSGRTGWDIQFNGGTWYDAGVFASSVSLFQDYAPSHGEIVFDLTTLGFSVGDVINTVSVRNHLGVGPDFTFGAFASGSSAPVPEPATMTLLGLGVAGMAIRRRMNRGA